MDLAVLEAPAAQVRIIGPPPGWVFGRALPPRTESLRRPPIIAASSRCVSARPGHPRSRGPARPTYRGGLSTRSCGSEASSFSLTAPRMIKISPRTGCVGLLRSRITCYFARDLVTSKQNKISNLTVIFSRFIAEAFSVSTETADRPPPRQRIEPALVEPPRSPRL